jgi:hypothetical protein
VTWIVTLLVLLLVAVVWQHPIARAIGTESAKPAPVAVAQPVALPPVAAPVQLPHRGRPHQLHHGTPRDPFQPLVTAPSVSGTAAAAAPSTPVVKHVKPGPADWGAVAAVPTTAPTTSTGGSTHAVRPTHTTHTGGSTQAAGSTHTIHATHTHATYPSSAPIRHHAPSAVGGCSATHVVTSGESLWSISAQHMVSHSATSITAAWHKLYAANHSTIGSNPSLLHVGERLCLPAT